MKNVTITLDKATAAWARLHAARRNLSLSRFVGELLRDRMRQSREYEEAMRGSLAEKPLKLKGDYMKRSDLYDRRRIR